MITAPGRISMEGSFGPGHFRGGNIGFFACHSPPLRHLWNIVAESDSASKCASNGTWTNPVARREPSKPVDGRANSSPSLSNGVKESRPVRRWALFFGGRRVESGSRAISKRSRFLSVGKIPEDGVKVFSSSERGQKRRKMAKRGAGRRSFRLRATTRGRIGPKFSQSVEETPVHVLRVKIARSKKKKKKKARTRSHSDLILAMR